MMPQNAITIYADVVAEREPGLSNVLQQIHENVNDNALLPFSRISENLHFARFVILPQLTANPRTPGKLVFLANVDGSPMAFLQEMVEQYPSGIDHVFCHCKDYPEVTRLDNHARLAFLQTKMIQPSAYYINTIGRPVKQILAEAKLRETIQHFLDDYDKSSAQTATAIRADIIDHIARHDTLADLLNKRDEPSWWWKLKEKLRFASILSAAIPAGIISSPFLLMWLLIIQIKENKDRPNHARTDIEHYEQLRANEDLFAHNQFSAVGFVKPGWIRLATLRTILFIANVSLRHIFNKGDLAGVKALGLDGVDTIHFARWVLIDDNKRLFFASNYDGSLESYMVDFVDKVAWGLNLVFSNGVDYPKSRWLVFEGARDEQTFKDFIGTHQLKTQAWYTPYGHLTAVNIANNEAIRDGLRGHKSEAEAQRWLQRL